MQGKNGRVKISANISEVFSSLQGEGPYTGTPMTFVRFSGCGLRCRFCDTPYALSPSPVCKVAAPYGGGRFDEYPNPLNQDFLNKCIMKYGDRIVSITGGEPLENADFLAAWLPSIHKFKKILLETNGIFFDELKMVADFVDIISMDIKLPSSAGVRPLWKEHSKFLSVSLEREKDIYVKMVVTDDTTDIDLKEAISLLVEADKFISLTIQPVSQNGNRNIHISDARLQSIFRLCKAWLPNTKIRPQMHKKWHVR